jgi:hypothetical protein
MTQEQLYELSSLLDSYESAVDDLSEAQNEVKRAKEYVVECKQDIFDFLKTVQ